jgi:hypothetical protein
VHDIFSKLWYYFGPVARAVGFVVVWPAQFQHKLLGIIGGTLLCSLLDYVGYVTKALHGHLRDAKRDRPTTLYLSGIHCTGALSGLLTR